MIKPIYNWSQLSLRSQVQSMHKENKSYCLNNGHPSEAYMNKYFYKILFTILGSSLVIHFVQMFHRTDMRLIQQHIRSHILGCDEEQGEVGKLGAGI